MIHTGDALTVLRTLPSASVQCCVTSPPYWGLRDYGIAGQLGAEKTAAEYIVKLVAIFGEVRRVLRDDGTCWLNIGDTVKNKSLEGVPWQLAFALRGDGWLLRSEIIWHKPNGMPDSASDRPSRVHETLFLFAKDANYFYDADAIREPHDSAYSKDAIRLAGGKTGGPRPKGNNFSKQARQERGEHTPSTRAERAALLNPLGRNARDVWSIPTKPYRGAHFAVFPEALPRRCLLAGSRVGSVVLDPFAGSGTTGAVAKQLGREFIGIELNADYVALAEARLAVGAS